ncbi:hypothetical protein TD95_004038 [Thielaviopsis punctulata]|uniref:Ribonuclease P protein subunit n=1 Tax=Thielaviopsis punctulata TaxID=72032 RepID=A0A0F4ZFT7_9PEZI|nr:hypothetical protein TD95_004038 [Thielaviopsis punctulata]
MASKQETEALTIALLQRAHSPSSAQRIYSEKINYRPLLLRPSSPPPTSNARTARRAARAAARQHRRTAPAPLSARAARRMGLHALPAAGVTYAAFLPLKALWEGYVRDLLAGDVFAGGSGAGATAAAKLAAAELHGAEVEVCRSRCTGRVGIKGIVVRDAQQTVQVVTEKNQVKTVPKEGTTFRVRLPVPQGENKGGAVKQEGQGDKGSKEEDVFVFEILGDQFMYRGPDRANKKFKNHHLKNL